VRLKENKTNKIKENARFSMNKDTSSDLKLKPHGCNSTHISSFDDLYVDTHADTYALSARMLGYPRTNYLGEQYFSHFAYPRKIFLSAFFQLIISVA